MQLIKDRKEAIDNFIASIEIKLNELRFNFKEAKTHEEILMFQNNILEYIKTLKLNLLKVIKGE